MDFVFFAFSSLSVAFSILLLFFLSGRSDRLIGWRYLILALIAAVLYYILLSTSARGEISLYYLYNIAPHVLLMTLLAIYIKKGKFK